MNDWLLHALALGFRWSYGILIWLGVWMYLRDVGKPREPISASDAALVTAINFVVILALIVLWGR